ncbi:MAG TPA: Uma2 family endonuclease [Vicinamibacteria bacterium]|nr:Uma2 family endonuclease [Vicinamibacteria bacterium]
MSSSPRRKHATYEDLAALPEHLVGEILDGDLFALPRPSPRHSLAASGLGGELFGRFGRRGGGDSPGGWWILDEPELHLGADVLVPDISGWRREKMTTLPETAFIELAPDWACEVLSPATEAIDRGRKMRVYAREGVSHLWLVNPIHRTLESYRLVASQWTLLQTFVGDVEVRAEPFEAVALDMSRWWVPDTKPEESAP